jgi:hypothetical protein
LLSKVGLGIKEGRGCKGLFGDFCKNRKEICFQKIGLFSLNRSWMAFDVWENFGKKD